MEELVEEEELPAMEMEDILHHPDEWFEQAEYNALDDEEQEGEGDEPITENFLGEDGHG